MKGDWHSLSPTSISPIPAVFFEHFLMHKLFLELDFDPIIQRFIHFIVE